MPLLRALVISVLLLPLHADAQANADLSQAAKSPYDIARFVDTHVTFDWAPLWKALGMRDLEFPNCAEGRQCSEELITVLDPFQVIVLLRDEDTRWQEVYLRFSRPSGVDGRGPWIFSGYYFNEVRQYEPSHELLRLGKTPLLLITATEHYGSIPDNTVQRWFDLTQPKLDPAFILLMDGSSYSADPDGIAIRSKGAIVSLESQPVERITVSYHLTVDAPISSEKDLGSYDGFAVYTRSKGAFVYQEETPQKAETGIGSLFHIWMRGSPSNDDLLHSLLPQLKKIAGGRNAADKEWLKRFLSSCKDSTEKREIQMLLAKTLPASR